MSSMGTVHCKRKEKKCLLWELFIVKKKKKGEEMSSIGTVHCKRKEEKCLLWEPFIMKGRRRNAFYRNCSL